MRKHDSGVSLIELMIAMGIMVLALLALMSSIFSSSRLVDNSKERTLAYEAARAKIEEMRNYTACTSFNNIYTYYRPVAGSTTAPNTAKVSGLNPILVNGVEQPMLSIHFPTTTMPTTTGSSPDLSENPPTTTTELTLLAQKLGVPKDLNRNGNTTDTSGINTTYNVLPVLVRVDWLGAGKRVQRVEIATFISDK